jgi:Fe-S cluster assembly scaffold protein SufB
LADGAAAAPQLQEPGWLSEARDRAKQRAGELALPDAKQKGWEFTDLGGLDFTAYTEEVARIEGLPENGTSSGPSVIPLAEAAATHPDVVRERLGAIVPATDVFTARNESRWRDGVLVHVPAGTRLEQPLRAELNWRALIVLEEGAEAEVWERYASDGDALFNGVVELVVGDGANLRYVCEQELSEESWVFATQRAEVGRPRREPRVGRARFRIGARQGADGDQAGRARLDRQGDRGLRRRRHPAPRLRHHPGACC